MTKDKLQLLDNILNVFDFPQNTIDQYKLDDSDKKIFISSLELFLKSKISKTHFSYKYVDFYLQSDLKYIDIVKFPKYPLPAVFNSTTKKVILNVSALEKRSIVNIDPVDLYSLILYSHVCGSLSSKKKIPDNVANIFCEYFSAIFLKIFSKAYGITGSYVNLIPYLRFLVSIYIFVSYFDLSLKNAVIKAKEISKFDLKKLEIDLTKYDFSNVKSFITVLNDSQVMPGINIYKFSNTMIKYFGVINFPIFEDLMRCCASIFSSSIPGNNYFTPSFQMIHPKLFSKIIDVVDKVVKI